MNNNSFFVAVRSQHHRMRYFIGWDGFILGPFAGKQEGKRYANYLRDTLSQPSIVSFSNQNGRSENMYGFKR